MAPLSFRVDGSVALVTGAGSGIGAATARALADAGASVVLVGRQREPLAAVALAIESAGGRARACPCDVTDSAAVRRLVAELPQLDIVVNNAGINIPQPFVEVSDEHLDRLLALNTRAVFVLSQAAVRSMLAQGRTGVVVNVTSQMGQVGAPLRTVYCMTKHAVEGLTKAMAVELAPQGIRVNSVAPTFVDTPLLRQAVASAPQRAELTARIPMGRMASEADVAAAVLYLASPAAAMVTGACLAVDGGWTAQ